MIQKYFTCCGNKVSRLKILIVCLQINCLRIFNLELQPLVLPDDGELRHALLNHFCGHKRLTTL